MWSLVISQSHQMPTGMPFHSRDFDPRPIHALHFHFIAESFTISPFSLLNFSHNARICGLADGWINRGHGSSKACQGLFHMGPGVLHVVWISDACILSARNFYTFKFRLLTSHRFPRSLILAWKLLHPPSPCILIPLTTHYQDEQGQEHEDIVWIFQSGSQATTTNY